jgi:hypothetical protein
MPGTNGTEYATIQAAVDARAAGDTIYVGSGNWTGFRMHDGVQGTASQRITIDGGGAANGVGGATINSVNDQGQGITVNKVDYVTVQGFLIPVGDHCINMVESKGYEIRNLGCEATPHGTGHARILVGFGWGLVEYNHLSYGGEHGIYISNSDSPIDWHVVRNNESDHNAAHGIQFNGDCQTLNSSGYSDGVISGAVIESNLIHDNTSSSIHLINVSETWVRSNVVYNNSGGGSVTSADQGCNLPNNNIWVANNTFQSVSNQTATRWVAAGNGSYNGAHGNLVFNNFDITTDTRDCVNDVTANQCDGSEGVTYRAGLRISQTTAAGGTHFTDYANHDFTLLSGSTAVNTGAAWQGVASPPRDYTGALRVGAADIGAYEYGTSGPSPDTTAPTTPGTPSCSSTAYQVSCTWSASTDGDWFWYHIYRDGVPAGVSLTASFTDTSVTAGAVYSYTVYAVDASRNISTVSGAANVTVPGLAGCLNSDTNWLTTGRTQQLPTLTGTYEITADVTPTGTGSLNGVFAVGPGLPAAYTDMAVIVQFFGGTIQARNYETYAADVSFAYSLGSAYHLRIPVNGTAHTYSVYVTAPGGMETLIAANYQFRKEQSIAASLGYASVHSDVDAVSACNLTVNGMAVNGMRYLSLTDAATGVVTRIAVFSHP